MVNFVGLRDVQNCTQHFVTSYSQEKRLCSATSPSPLQTPQLPSPFQLYHGISSSVSCHTAVALAGSLSVLWVFTASVLFPVPHGVGQRLWHQLSVLQNFLSFAILWLTKITPFSFQENSYISHFMLIYN